MAKKEKEDLDLDVEGGKKSSKLKLIIIVLVVGLVFAGLGVGGAWYFLGMQPPMVADTDTDAGDEEAAMDGEEEDKPKKKKKRKKRAPEGPPLFSELDPDFVISFKDQKLARFMQLRVKLMSRDPEIIEVVEQYKPILRNNLLLLFSSQKFEEVVTREGKEKLLEEALEEVNRTLEEEADSDGVDAVYFTSFVAQ